MDSFGLYSCIYPQQESQSSIDAPTTAFEAKGGIRDKIFLKNQNANREMEDDGYNIGLMDSCHSEGIKINLSWYEGPV